MSKTNTDRKAFVKETFEKRYGSSPKIWTRAPGRVDLMGSHTDYNMGFVMTMTINRDTWIAASPREDQRVSIASCNVAGASTFSLENIQQDPGVPWTNYVRGIAVMLKAAGYGLQGFDGLVHSTVPFGSGLSSSAAIEMATAMVFKTLGDLELDPLEMALIGQRAENEFVGVNTGILDQYSSAMGEADSALLLDCRHLTSDVVSLPPDFDVIICNTCAERSLVGSEYDDRRAQCEQGLQDLQRSYPDITALRDVTPGMFSRKQDDLPEVVARRCQFVIEENQRVLDLAQVLTAGNQETLRDLFTASFQGARELYEIVSPEMEAMYRAMTSAPGVMAARQAGAGFGGSMVALVRKESIVQFSDHVRVTYYQETGIQPEIYPVKASPGAGSLN